MPQGAVGHDTVQVTPLFAESLATVAVKFRDWPGSTVCGVDGDTDTKRAMTVTEPGADLVLSAADVAVTLTVRFAATEFGAVYFVVAPLAVVAGDTLPHCAAEQDTAQETPLSEESFATVAIKLIDCPSSTLCAANGVMLTEICAGLVGGDADWPLAQPKLLAARNTVLRIASSEMHFFDLMATSHSDFGSAFIGSGVISYCPVQRAS